MKKYPVIIGRFEHIDIVGSINNIPAKIDTGADTSSIWATDIKKIKNDLHFKLFGNGYAKYTGNTLKVSDFKTIRVKNSFGISETRYKVKLKIIAGDTTTEEFFTLADRSNNTHPVLLGKTFLTDRFIVDVSKSDILSKSSRKSDKILVLTTRIDDNVKNFYKMVDSNLSPKNINIDVVKFNELRFEITDETIKVLAKNKNIAEYALVYIKNYKIVLDQAIAVVNFCRYASIPVIDEELLCIGLSISKLSEMVKLKIQRLPVINSVISSTSYHAQSLKIYENMFGFPLVIKDAFADRGVNNYVVYNKKEFYDILLKMPNDALPIVQKYIPNDGFYRIVLFDYKTKMIIYRESSSHKDPNKIHLNKPAGGHNSQQISIDTVDKKILKLAERCSKVMKRNVAGVDLIKDSETGKVYILEVNYNPAMVADSRKNEKSDIFAKYLNEKITKGQ